MAIPSPGAALLAAAMPLVLLHVDYQPGFSLGSGAADVDVLLSDLALLAVAAAVAVSVGRHGAGPLRRSLPLWLLGAAFLAWVAIGVVHPLASDREYAFAEHAITAAKFGEYAVLALAVPVLARRRNELELLLGVIAGWGAVATAVGLAQFAGAGVFDAWPAGYRQPSFLGHHDFAALAGCTLTIGLSALVFQKHKRLAAAAVAAGAVGLVLSGSVAGLLGVLAALAASAYVLRQRRMPWRPLAMAATGIAVAGLALIAFRGNDLDDFLRFAGLKGEPAGAQAAAVQTYSHRTALAYLGLRLWSDHPVAGAGWQASSEYAGVSSYVPDARRRFPDVPAEAFPAPGRPYGVQNAWVQALADLGAIGFVLFAALLAAGVAVGLRGARAGAWPGLAAAGLLLVCAADWTAQGLVAALAVDSLTWLGLGIAAAGVARG